MSHHHSIVSDDQSSTLVYLEFDTKSKKSESRIDIRNVRLQRTVLVSSHHCQFVYKLGEGHHPNQENGFITCEQLNKSNVFATVWLWHKAVQAMRHSWKLMVYILSGWEYYTCDLTWKLRSEETLPLCSSIYESMREHMFCQMISINTWQWIIGNSMNHGLITSNNYNHHYGLIIWHCRTNA